MITFYDAMHVNVGSCVVILNILLMVSGMLPYFSMHYMRCQRIVDLPMRMFWHQKRPYLLTPHLLTCLRSIGIFLVVKRCKTSSLNLSCNYPYGAPLLFAIVVKQKTSERKVDLTNHSLMCFPL